PLRLEAEPTEYARAPERHRSRWGLLPLAAFAPPPAGPPGTGKDAPMQTFWLGELANESLGNFASTPEIDRDFSARALLARDDPDEAWQLFRLLAWKIERFVRRYRHWRLAPWELADIVQETYPLFLKTL